MCDEFDIVKILESSIRNTVSVESGTLLSSSSSVLELSCGDPKQSKSRSYYKHYNSSFAMTSGTVSFSKSKALRIALQENQESNERYWEVWNSTRLIQVKSLSKIHSGLAGYACFGGIAWSSDDKHALYVAQPIHNKSSSFWSGEENLGNSNLYTENFGEGLLHLTNPTLYLYNISENSVKSIETNVDIFPAQPCFQPGTGTYTFIGFEKTAYVLALADMLNRSSKLYQGSLFSEKIEEIEILPHLMAALFPKFSPNGEYISYYGVPKDSLCHCMCLSMNIYNTSNQETKTIVEVVHDYNPQFNGIYGYHDVVSTYQWISNEKVVFCTWHDASLAIFMTDLHGHVTSIDIPMEKPYCSSILDACENALLIKSSNIKTLDQVFIVKFQDLCWEVSLLDDTSQIPLTPMENLIKKTLSECKIKLIAHSSSSVKSVLYYLPANRNLMVIVHGGPHSSGIVSYNCISSTRLAIGFNILLANYHGSTGFGESTVECLLGNIGTIDVGDCKEAIALARDIVDIEKIIVVGKSHGAFIAMHLSCEMDLAGSVLDNGPINLAGVSLQSDMTDWFFSEALKSNISLPITPENYRRMYRASPNSRLRSVKCPILLVAGERDSNIPPVGMLEAYRVLKHNQMDVELLWYSGEGHGLSGIAANYDYLASSLRWIHNKVN